MLTALIATMALAPGDVATLNMDTWAKEAAFAPMVPGKLPIGYQLKRVEQSTINDRPCLRLVYTNNATMHNFDILEMPAKEGVQPMDSVVGILGSQRFSVPYDDSMTRVAKRVKGLDVALIAGMISGPSAEAVIDEMQMASGR